MRNRSAPPSAIVPVLRYPYPPEAAAWLVDHLGFRVRLRIAAHRVQLVRGGEALVVHEAGPPPAPGIDPPLDGEVMLRCDDVRDTHATALAGGARELAAPTDHDYGERQSAVLDPWGHRWTLTQSIADVDPATFGATDVDLRT